MKFINKIMNGIMLTVMGLSVAIIAYAALGLGDKGANHSTSENSYVKNEYVSENTTDGGGSLNGGGANGSYDSYQDNIADYTPTETTPVYVLNSGIDLNSLVYNGEDVIVLNNNVPNFSEAEKKNVTPYEYYSPLDGLGRCGVCYAVVCKETMPTEERGNIGDVKPTGWQTVKYNDLVDGNYLYNRCHLIGFQLTGENANTSNLITGTRHMNADSMLTYENMIANYVRGTNKHVLYRVTPYFAGNNLLATGVQMEAYSVEDGGQGVSFNVYCFNVQKGIGINYANGDSWVIQANNTSTNTNTNSNTTNNNSNNANNNSNSTTNNNSSTNNNSTNNNSSNTNNNNTTNNDTNNNNTNSTGVSATAPKDSKTEASFILNTNTMKIHMADCKSVNDIKEEHKKSVTSTIEKLKEEKYEPCQNCLKGY